MKINWMLVFGVVIILLFIFVIAFIPLIEEKELDKFCEGEGYDYGEKNVFRWEKSYCVLEENMVLIKVEVDKCGDNLQDYCFVKGE